MMRISDATLLALSRKMAARYPYSAYRIFSEARKIAEVNGYKLIMEIEKPLLNRINYLMLNGIK